MDNTVKYLSFKVAQKKASMMDVSGSPGNKDKLEVLFQWRI